MSRTTAHGRISLALSRAILVCGVQGMDGRLVSRFILPSSRVDSIYFFPPRFIRKHLLIIIILAGMTRVLAVIMKSFVGSPNPWRQLAIDDLTYWIREIIESAVALTPTSTPLLHNYLDDDDWFPEISGSCMLASVVYRMAVLRPDVFVEYIPWADNIRTELGSGEYITPAGIVSPAINPLDWGDWSPYITGSPEGQAMVILMYAGWRDCVYAMVCATSSVPDKRGMQKHRRERH